MKKFCSDIIGVVEGDLYKNCFYDMMATSSPGFFTLKRICKSVGALSMNYSYDEIEKICDFINTDKKHLVLNPRGTKWLTRLDDGRVKLHWQEHPNPDAITALTFMPETANNLLLFVEQIKVMADVV